MTREEVVVAFATNNVNMSDIFFHRNDFTKDELARMLMEVYYEAVSHVSGIELAEFHENVGDCLKEIWE